MISENLDIASFRGLLSYPVAKDRDHHDITSSPSLCSEDGSMSPVNGKDVRGEVPCVTSVSVGTKPVDFRPSAYIGFPEGTAVFNVLLCMTHNFCHLHNLLKTKLPLGIVLIFTFEILSLLPKSFTLGVKRQ